jgi:hypothetical protein
MTVEQLTETIILMGPKGNVWQAPRGNLVINHDGPAEVIFKRFDDDTATTWSLIATALGPKDASSHASLKQRNLGQLGV